MSGAVSSSSNPHIPVLLRPLLAAVSPVSGTWLDGTFGAGGYTRGLLEAGAEKVIGVDRDPLAFEMAADWAGDYGDRLVMQPGVFSRMDEYAQDLDGVVLDLGVSSMQLDLAERGFSFMKDGPLDMRMSQEGESAADLVNTATEAQLADILFHYGEERASRRIAKAIVKARAEEPITTTLRLAEIIESCLPRPKPGQSHPATRSFQGLRIAVNAEYDELFQGLMAAERALKPGGQLAVVTFHSIEDRMVKRFFQSRAGKTGRANRYAPEMDQELPQFTLKTRKAVGPDEQELQENPRARSAKLRVAIRTEAPAGEIEARAIGMPQLGGKGKMKSILYVLTALSVFGLALWAYQENYRTQQVVKEMQALQGEIGLAQVKLAVLNAEWAYLNRPDRLRELADLNFERMGLLPLRAEQFGRADQIAYAEDPDLPVVDPIELQAITDIQALGEVQIP